VRILIVKLSSLGDVVHAMPVVHDILRAHPGATIDWVVEPAFAPLLWRLQGLRDVIECPLRRWSRGWWRTETRAGLRALRGRLRREPYDAILDLQGLTKSALVAGVARGVRYGLANRTEGSSHEAPARWLVDRAIRIEPHIHALDRARELAARALGYAWSGPPDFGLGPAAVATATRDPAPARGVGATGKLETRAPTVPAAAASAPCTQDLESAGAGAPTLVFLHGSSRDDKLWPEADWIALGRRAIDAGWRIALPRAGAAESARAERLAAALGPSATVWPELDLGGVLERLRDVQGAIGVDSGLSHIAVALGLPHVQLYNFPTAWRTGPQPAHGHRHQVSVEGRPAPSLHAVWDAWHTVCTGRPA
jgi:heptosyltransferase-1